VLGVVVFRQKTFLYFFVITAGAQKLCPKMING